jgi:hypothetical protein
MDDAQRRGYEVLPSLIAAAENPAHAEAAPGNPGEHEVAPVIAAEHGNPGLARIQGGGAAGRLLLL